MRPALAKGGGAAMEDLNIFSKAYLDHTRKMREKFF